MLRNDHLRGRASELRIHDHREDDDDLRRGPYPETTVCLVVNGCVVVLVAAVIPGSSPNHDVGSRRSRSSPTRSEDNADP